MKPGDAYIDKTAFGTPHMWVCLAVANGRVLAVNVSDSESPRDDSCTVNCGDHSYINRESRIFYRGAQDYDEHRIDADISRKFCRTLDPVSPALLLRMQQGALVSPHMKQSYKDMLTAAGITPPTGVTVSRRRLRR